MFNKKRGSAPDELLGTIVFMLGASFLIIIFLIYLKVDDKNEIDKLVISTKQFSIIEDLNFLLDTPTNNNKKVTDLIRESYATKNYENFEKITREFLNRKQDNWILVIYDNQGFPLFDITNANDQPKTETLVTERDIFVQNPNTKMIEKIRIILVAS